MCQFVHHGFCRSIVCSCPKCHVSNMTASWLGASRQVSGNREWSWRVRHAPRVAAMACCAVEAGALNFACGRALAHTERRWRRIWTGWPAFLDGLLDQEVDQFVVSLAEGARRAVDYRGGADSSACAGVHECPVVGGER